MTQHPILVLVHFCGLDAGEEPNLACGSRVLGLYSSEPQALSAIRQVQDKPGFRGHPDGFRLFSMSPGRTCFSEGFRAGPEGRDVAIADDSSHLVGDDSRLADWPDAHDRNPAEDEAILDAVTSVHPDGWLWCLRHFKITETSSQAFEDMGEKLVGIYRQRSDAGHAAERLRGKPGFRDWPGGFRVTCTLPDDAPDFADGFGDPDREEG